MSLPQLVVFEAVGTYLYMAAEVDEEERHP
jgi:hypothetical protein